MHFWNQSGLKIHACVCMRGLRRTRRRAADGNWTHVLARTARARFLHSRRAQTNKHKTPQGVLLGAGVDLEGKLILCKPMYMGAFCV